MHIYHQKQLRNRVVIIKAWRASKSNFVYSCTTKEEKALGKQSVQLMRKRLPEENYYFAQYRFTIKEKGKYNIFWAGSPPGPVKEGSEWFSPFWIYIDKEKIPENLYNKVMGYLHKRKFDHIFVLETLEDYEPRLNSGRITETKEGSIMIGNYLFSMYRAFGHSPIWVTPSWWVGQKLLGSTLGCGYLDIKEDMVRICNKEFKVMEE